MTCVARLNETVIPQLISSGCFGQNCDITYKIDSSRSGEDQFSSSVLFIELFIKSENINKNVKVVVKFQLEGQLVWDVYRKKEEFQNELNMYSKIFPVINKDGIIEELFCRYYHGVCEKSDKIEKDFIVLEDLSDKGYKLCSDKVFLDYEHCAVALKAIGKLHGLSYAVKRKDMNSFLQVVGRLQPRWEKDYILKWKDLLYLCGKRGVMPLIEEKKHVDLLKDFLKNFEDPAKFYESIVASDEPESVACHGDFNRNNILFRYNKEGHPDSAKLFDFQLAMYASPVTDLSFFFFMNTTQELRDKHWDDFLDIYYDAVRSVVPDMDIPKLNFKKFSVLGYIIASYFLPFMVSSDNIDMLELMALNPHDQAVRYSEIGGEKATKILADIVKHLVQKGHIQASYY